MADNKIIHELLKEVREKLEENRDEAIEWHSETVRRLDKYNNQLEQHIEGVNTLKKLHKDNVKRIAELEKPGIAWAYMFKVLIKIGAASGAVVGIAKLLGLF